MNSTEKLIAELWEPTKVRQMAHEFADVAADELVGRASAVRRPGSSRRAGTLVKADKGVMSPVMLARRVQRESLHLSHPRFLAQQVAAPIPAAALVESLVAAMNQSLAVWEMSPIATAIDRDLIARFKTLFRYPMSSEGSLVPGGALANLTALLAARDTLDKDAHRTGKTRVAIITGEQTHYSVTRAAKILGLGSDAVFHVDPDRRFRTDPAAVTSSLAKARKAGFRNFVVVGSAGSTPTGSFDDLTELRRVATVEGAWLHVDAAHGGGLMFSRRYRRCLRGIRFADSIAFDPHKMMFMPLSAGCVLIRRRADLRRSLAEQASYLFGSKRAWPDIGQVTIACSQRFDALKVWLVWRAYGAKIWDALATHVCELAEIAYRYCLQSSILEPLHKPDSNIFCFQLRGRRNDGHSDRLHWKLKEALNESGFGYISSTVLGGRRVFRLVIMNPRTTSSEVRAVLDWIARRAGGKRT
jgi:L-2,4-diaminobutyrate decarboxylase